MVVPSVVRIARSIACAEALGAGAAERQQADRFGVDLPSVEPLADRVQPAVVVDDDLHVVLVIAVLAVDRDADAVLVAIADAPAPSARR